MDLSVNVHTKLLTHKWHELLVLTTSAYQAIHGTMRMGTTRTDGEKVELHQEVITFQSTNYNISYEDSYLYMFVCGWRDSKHVLYYALLAFGHSVWHFVALFVPKYQNGH